MIVTRKKSNMWYYHLMMAAGILLLVLAIMDMRKTMAFLSTAERTVGTVTTLTLYDDADGKFYSPIFTFRTKNNVEYTYELSESSSPSSWEVGEQAVVVYSPDDPSDARLFSYFRVFNWTIILIAIALPLLVIGGGYYLTAYFFKMWV